MAWDMVLLRFDKVGQFWCGLAGALALLATFTGCASKQSSFTDPRYSTVYLGADGRIVGDPRAREQLMAGNTGAREQKKKSGPLLAPVIPAWSWTGDGVTGVPSITINLTDQRAYFYKGGKLVGDTPISSGREGYDTPTGQFRISQKSRDHLSNLYGNYVDSAGNVVMANIGVKEDKRPPGARFQGAPMPYFMRIHGGVGLHAGYLPGYPASHGCIRVPPQIAEIFFANASVGTPVAVVR